MTVARYLSNRVLCGEGGVTVSPATLDRLLLRVAVVPEQVLQQVFRNAEDESAAMPLHREYSWRGKKKHLNGLGRNF